MPTVLDLVNLSLFSAGIVGTGQTASAQDANNAYTMLNYMLSEWQRKRWLVWHLVDLAVVSNGSVSYTVGPGGNINVPQRPDRLEAAYLRQLVAAPPFQVDFPIQILEAREDYSRISLKELTSFTRYMWYDAAYPLGAIFPWPLPNATIYELHILIKEQLSQFTSLSQTFNLPLEYENTIHWNLTDRLIAAYQVPLDPDQRNKIERLAKDSLNTIRKANAQIPRLTMPTNLIRPGVYNPYSDQIQ
jgi:hypothetical protein